jgi:hypothetical protein
VEAVTFAFELGAGTVEDPAELVAGGLGVLGFGGESFDGLAASGKAGGTGGSAAAELLDTAWELIESMPGASM